MNALITKCLETSSIGLLYSFPEKMMTKKEKEVVGWIIDYTSKYSRPPSMKRLLENFNTFVPVSNEDPLGDIYERTLVRKRNLHTRQYLMDIQEKLKSGEDPLPYIQELHQTISMDGRQLVRYSQYDRSEYTRREVAYPYGIPMIDKQTGGIGKGDLIYLAGRLGVGKTTFAVWIVAKWLLEKRRILLISNENRPDDIISKIDAFIGGWNPLKRRTLDWTDDELERIKTVTYLASSLEGDVIIPNRPVKSIGEIRGLKQAVQPDIVMIDGIYLMEGARGESMWEKITHISRDLKQLAEEDGTPTVGITQASRKAVGKRMEIDDLAYSDALGQDADLLLGINKEPEQELFVECLKNRWGGEGWGMFLKLFFETMTVKLVDPAAAAS